MDVCPAGDAAVPPDISAIKLANTMLSQQIRDQSYITKTRKNNRFKDVLVMVVEANVCSAVTSSHTCYGVCGCRWGLYDRSHDAASSCQQRAGKCQRKQGGEASCW